MPEAASSPIALPDLDCLTCRDHITEFRLVSALRQGPTSREVLDAAMDRLLNIGERAEAHIRATHGPSGGRISWDFLLGEVKYSPALKDTTNHLQVLKRLDARRT